jgi:hypothetical protein
MNPVYICIWHFATAGCIQKPPRTHLSVRRFVKMDDPDEVPVGLRLDYGGAVDAVDGEWFSTPR